MELDHLRYVRERSYRRAVHLDIRRHARKRRPMRMTVVHRTDRSCCAIQRWSETFAHLVTALSADGLRSLGLVPGIPDAEGHDAVVTRALEESA